MATEYGRQTVGKIEPLIEEVRSLIGSDENQRRQAAQDRLNRKEPVNLFNDWNFTTGVLGSVLMWRKWLDRNLDVREVGGHTGRISHDFAAEMVEFQLLQKIHKFKNSRDDTPVSPVINTNLGLYALFREGPQGKTRKVDETTGAHVVVPTIKSESDLEAIEKSHVTFDRSLHEERVRAFEEIVGYDFPVVDDELPGYMGSPFGTAYNMRGGLEILTDFRTAPEFVHKLMGCVTRLIVTHNTEARAVWREVTAARGERAGHDGPPVVYEDSISGGGFSRGGVWMGTVASDEVSCDMFSPADYDEFIHPYEYEVARTFDYGYYHSCGNLTPLFERIVNLPNMHRVHVSPWSDMNKAIEVCAGSVILEKHLDPRVHLERLSRKEMRTYVKKVTDLGTGYPLDMVVPTFTAAGRLYKELFYEETAASSSPVT